VPVVYVHSLPRGKERTKKTDFGKPKLQVCLFAKREHRASHGRKHCAPRRSLLELPWHCRATWHIKRDYIKILRAVHQILPPRAAGVEAKSFLFKFLVVIECGADCKKPLS